MYATQVTTCCAVDTSMFRPCLDTTEESREGRASILPYEPKDRLCNAHAIEGEDTAHNLTVITPTRYTRSEAH